MPRSAIFYFDFVSTYSYFAFDRFARLAEDHGLTVDWRVVSLPHILKQNGTTPPPQQPRKFEHNKQDVRRLSQMLNIPYTFPTIRPLDATAARIAFYSLKRRDRGLAEKFAGALLTRYFAQNEEVRTPEQIAAAVSDLGITLADVEAAACDAQARNELHGMLQTALDDGMCGAPFVVIDRERFWGQDRVIDHVRWWLTK